jgi:hypothetical protein
VLDESLAVHISVKTFFLCLGGNFGAAGYCEGGFPLEMVVPDYGLRVLRKTLLSRLTFGLVKGAI